MCIDRYLRRAFESAARTEELSWTCLSAWKTSRNAENYLAQGDLATATPLLERLVELAEEYIDAECKTEEKRQYFSFDSKFERLAYRRVEKDPRELVQVEVPFDRLYSDMAFAYIRQQDYVSARNALMQAVRWDPMNCNYRLDLAELFRALEDKQEWASLSFSVLERASDGKCAARAYTNLGQYFLEPETENISAAVGCARLALRLAPNDAHTTRLLNKIHTTYPDAADESDDHVMGELACRRADLAFGRDCHLPDHVCDRRCERRRQAGGYAPDGPCPRPGGRRGVRGDYQAGARE